MKVEASDGRKNYNNYHNTQINSIFGEVASTPSPFVRRHFADTNNWCYFEFFFKKTHRYNCLPVTSATGINGFDGGAIKNEPLRNRPKL